MRVTYSGVDELSRKFKAAAPIAKLWKQKALQQVEMQTFNKAQIMVPVRSGALQDSLEHERTTTTATVFTDLYYAVYVHNGTYKLDPQPFLFVPFIIAVGQLPASWLAMIKGIFR